MTAPDNDRTDRIAREAARQIALGNVDSVQPAIRAAADALGMHDPADWPSVHRVRQHAQAMSMQALGTDGYERSVRAMHRAAEELMAALEMFLPGTRTLLMGRAAEGHLDAGVVIHLRLIGNTTVEEIGKVIENDLEIQNQQWRTVDTRVGRLNQVTFDDAEHVFAITRVPTSIDAPANVDLFRGDRVASLDLAGVRDLLERS